MTDQPTKYVDPITDEHLRAIGRVIVRWAMTERVVMDSLWEIATGQSFDGFGPDGPVSFPDAGISLALVTGMDARVMLGIIKAVFHARHPADADEFNKLADRLAKLGKTRNAIAHGRWTKGKRPGTIEAASFRSSGKLGVDLHGFTAKELHAVADRIKNSTWQFADFLQARGYWKRPKPLAASTPPTP